MWICVCGDTNVRIWLCKDTGTMNRSLRLAECSHPISRVDVECFAECSPRNWQVVSSCRGPIYRARIYVNTHEMGDEYAYLVIRICVIGNVRIRAR